MQPVSSNLKVPLKHQITHLWQQRDTKLKEVKQRTTNRLKQVILSRLRLGHIYFSEMILQNVKNIMLTLSVKHFLIGCNIFIIERKKHQLSNNLRDLLDGNCLINKLFDFLESLDILDKTKTYFVYILVIIIVKYALLCCGSTISLIKKSKTYHLHAILCMKRSCQKVT